MNCRYGPRGEGGMRLDESDDINVGRIIDCGYQGAPGYTIFVRDQNGAAADIQVSTEDIWHLREWCNYVLESEGMERTVTVQVMT